MSLLFDALNRAQAKDAQDNDAGPLQMPDASTHLSPGNKPAEKEEATEAARALSTSAHAPQSAIQTYAIAGLTLLIIITAWFYYQMNRYSAISTLQPVPITTANLSHTAAPGSSVASLAASANQQFALASPGAGTGVDTATESASKPTTKPAATSPKKQRSRRKPLDSGIVASTNLDPLKRAYRALSEGRLDQAEQQYLAVLGQHPHEKDALLGMAVIAQRRLQTDRAADLYRQVLREDMGNAAAAAGLVSLSVQADPLAAESQLKELIDIRPTAPEFHYALGNVLARQQRWGEAQQAFFRAHSLSPGNPLYAYNLAVALEHLHQPAAALPYYEKALRLSASSDPTLDRSTIGQRIKELEQQTRTDLP